MEVFGLGRRRSGDQNNSNSNNHKEEKEKEKEIGTPRKSQPLHRTISSILEEDEEIRALKKKEKPTNELLQKLFFACEERFEYRPVEDRKVAKWRTKQRTKTVGVALVVCLNIGVDPPDVIKTSPCARLECWIDPFSGQPQKVLEQIGRALQQQYERWQLRAKYRQCLDPTVEDVKKLCLSMRRNAKEERVLFHYNGHGVPKPTNNGEVWVFNKTYTQYIPVSVYELQTWIGSPSVYVFDCSAAGLVIDWFNKFADQRAKEQERGGQGTGTLKDYILLAACGRDELLPMNPDLPADVFTACLTSPIKIALRWCLDQSRVVKGVTPDMIDKLPGRVNDRKTPLGELDWIFTAVTDTIAWNVLPKDLFQKLFRQDLLVASLFRNFLLAERIMRSANCTPISWPALPPTYQHAMWQAWDLAADVCLAQLPALLADPAAEYKPSYYFTEQLTAFDVWLEFGSEKKRPPEQLPIVLQVVLSQAHRHNALVLLAKFLDLGPWAVELALSVGIFPYMLKLLQSTAVELRHSLLFIWAKILSLDKSCQVDLVKDNGQNYFINVLSNINVPTEQRTLAAYALSVIVDNCRPGQSACLNAKLVGICLSAIGEANPLLRRWVALCLAKLWEEFDEAKWVAVKELAHQRICVLLTDPFPEVRAAAVYALGTFMGGAGDNEQRKIIELNLAVTLPVVTTDGSPLVRRELAITLSKLVSIYEENCREVAVEMVREELRLAELKKEKMQQKKPKKKDGDDLNSSAGEDDLSGMLATQSPLLSGVYGCIWKMVLSLTHDPVASLAATAQSIVLNMQGKIQVGTPEKPERSASINFIRRYAPISIASPKIRKKDKEKEKGLTKSVSAEDLSQLAQQPASPLFSRALETPNGVGGSYGGELRSDFFNWSWQQFARPLGEGGMEALSGGPPPTDPTHPLFTQRVWRQERTEALLTMAKQFKSAPHKIKQQIALLPNETEMASLLAFHPLENIIFVADNKDDICLWDWLDSRKVTEFKNGNAPGCRVSAMSLVNPHDDALLLTGTDNGIVRVWKGFYEGQAPEMVTAWRALPDLLPRPAGPGMIMNWQQQHGVLMTSGDVGIIRVWDVERELSIQDIVSGSESCVTSLANQAGKGQVVVAGFGDGSVHIYDCRGKYSPVLSYQEHQKWVVNVAITYLDSQIISGSITGEIKFWDIRKTISYKTLATRNELSAFVVHPFIPVLACGSQSQTIQIIDFEGKKLNQIQYHEGFLGQRIGPVSCLTFHPYRPLLAGGGTDSIVAVYTGSS